MMELRSSQRGIVDGEDGSTCSPPGMLLRYPWLHPCLLPDATTAPERQRVGPRGDRERKKRTDEGLPFTLAAAFLLSPRSPSVAIVDWEFEWLL